MALWVDLGNVGGISFKPRLSQQADAETSAPEEGFHPMDEGRRGSVCSCGCCFWSLS